MQLVAAVTVSPTFVLVEKGREIGRITGYPGADFFWGLLAELIAKFDRGAVGFAPLPDNGWPMPAPRPGKTRETAAFRSRAVERVAAAT